MPLRRTPEGPLKASAGRLTVLNVGAEANQAVNAQANEEVYEHAQIDVGTVMAQGVGQVGNQRKIVDQLSQKNRGKVLKPTPWSGS